MTPEVWVVPQAEGYHLIVKQPYGGCYDVVKVGATGVTFIEELSELPAGAVRLGALEPVDEKADDWW